MGIPCIITHLQDSFRQINELSEAELFYLETKPVGYAATKFTGKWLTFKKYDKEMKTDVIYLQIAATAENFAIIEKISKIVFRNLSPLADGKIYTISKDAALPLNQSFWNLPLAPNGEKYVFP